MSDKFQPISISHLFHILLRGEEKGNIFGIPKELLFKADPTDPFRLQRYGQELGTPIGVAAGPHTQLAQNIISSWLCGARYIELKTVQTLDKLNVPKPCIDMADEGYNCEWSQELTLPESYHEYLNAWILIHAMHSLFGWEGPLGTVFNMSLGYDMKGILQENVQWFLDKMNNCRLEKDAKVAELQTIFPKIATLDIPNCISNNVTLSTMHGCPPEEIEKIGRYLMEEKGYHTTIKLNPTLLGPETLLSILNTTTGFKTEVPDLAFEHDLKYPQAVNMIKELSELAESKELKFSIKLTNTLENKNIWGDFDKSVEIRYMSGRALHPIAINLAKKLQTEFSGKLDISFSAGADCFNIEKLISCGLSPVTVCSDILKPGGYGRLSQYLYKLKDAFKEKKSSTIEQFILSEEGSSDLSVGDASLLNLIDYAKEVLKDDAYKQNPYVTKSIKTNRKLGAFDCIQAPCVTTCPTHQDIPEYMYYTALGDFTNAFRVILRTNPFPSVLGQVCGHSCQSKCTRINYDNALLIREIKRFVTEKEGQKFAAGKIKKNGRKVAIIGAGPSGLSCAHFLALSGFEVSVYEGSAKPGGMVKAAIPRFRISDTVLTADVARITDLGVRINYNEKVDRKFFMELQQKNDFLYIAAGAQNSKKLGIEGEDAAGVLDPLKFLSDVKEGKNVNMGRRVAVIGGGNTAMDVARTAARLVGVSGSVTVIYRRTRNEMPAEHEEISACFEEGVELLELTSPESVVKQDGKVKGLICYRLELSGKDESGRPKPNRIQGSEHELAFDTIIPALGQELQLDFVDNSLLSNSNSVFETQMENVFIGGEALRRASTVVEAVADGKAVAVIIVHKAGLEHPGTFRSGKKLSTSDYQVRRGRRKKGIQSIIPDAKVRMGFTPFIETLTQEQAISEASRCLFCDELCDICVSVCPNRANYAYTVEAREYKMQKAVRKEGKIVIEESELFKMEQENQVLNIADFCNECGNCTTFCPTSGAPYRDKPKFYLSFPGFNAADEGYFVNTFIGNTIIIKKSNSEIKTLTRSGDIYFYDTNKLVAKLNVSDFSLKEVNFKVQSISEATFEEAVIMSILLEKTSDLYVQTRLF